MPVLLLLIFVSPSVRSELPIFLSPIFLPASSVAAPRLGTPILLSIWPGYAKFVYNAMRAVSNLISGTRGGLSGMPSVSRLVKPALERVRNGAPTRKSWSDEDLMSLPRNGYKHELLNGKIIMSPAGFAHGDICANLSTELNLFVRKRKLGKVCDGQTGFRLRHGIKKKTVLSPDVSFVSRARVEAATAPLEAFFEGAPDLAVEVLSPGDRKSSVESKIQLYFRNGCRCVWVVDPVSRHVHVRLAAGEIQLKGVADYLQGGALLPGFRLPVRRIFE
jgi:Uma2 family endonuclease